MSAADAARIATARSATDTARTDAVRSLHALFDAQWERDLRDSPVMATYLGDRRYDDRWPDFSRAQLDRTLAADRQVLKDLAAIPREALPADEQLNYDLFRRDYETRVGVARFHPKAYSMSASSGPQFYYATSDELFRAYVVAAKTVEPELPKLFGKLYRTPFGIRPIPDTSAPNTTTAYYQPPSADGRRAGYYYVNLYRPEVRPKYEIEVLSVHEAVPGHHLQIALQLELGEQPNFRRFGGYTAYMEGWGLYSERLVVDTGLHVKKWTRQQAIDDFEDNAAKTHQDIVNEIDRYIADPGQALAYEIGQLKLLELRARATRELGDRFDIRAFHDTVLSTGAVPLDVLERNVDAWIGAQRATH